MEAVDGGDVGENPCDRILRDSSLCELSAKYLQKGKKHTVCIQTLKCNTQMFPKTTECGSYSWHRHVNKEGEVCMLPFIHINIFGFLSVTNSLIRVI